MYADTSQPTVVSLLLKIMINLFEGVGDENSIVLVGNQLWHCLAQRHSITSEKVPRQGFIISGWGGNHLLKNQQSWEMIQRMESGLTPVSSS